VAFESTMTMVFGPFSAVFCTTPVVAVAPFCTQPVMVCSPGAFLGASCAATVTDNASAPAAPLKSATFAPIPSARPSTATSVNPGDLIS
jgi:hypothetical protein